MKTEKYVLIGEVVVTGWYGGRGGALLKIETDGNGLKEIHKNPLQDYLGYGVQAVDFVNFEVYKKTEIDTDNKLILINEKEPFTRITAGKIPKGIKIPWDNLEFINLKY